MISRQLLKMSRTIVGSNTDEYKVVAQIYTVKNLLHLIKGNFFDVVREEHKYKSIASSYYCTMLTQLIKGTLDTPIWAIKCGKGMQYPEDTRVVISGAEIIECLRRVLQQEIYFDGVGFTRHTTAIPALWLLDYSLIPQKMFQDPLTKEKIQNLTKMGMRLLSAPITYKEVEGSKKEILENLGDTENIKFLFSLY